MDELSERDKQVFEYIQAYDAEQNGAPAPSYRDIVAACKLATSTAQVRTALHHLTDAGLIIWYPGVARSIRLKTPQDEPPPNDTKPHMVISRRSNSRGWA